MAKYDNKTAYNIAFVLCRRTDNRASTSAMQHQWFGLNVINLATEFTMNIFNFSKHLMRADGFSNSATNTNVNLWWQV